MQQDNTQDAFAELRFRLANPKGKGIGRYVFHFPISYMDKRIILKYDKNMTIDGITGFYGFREHVDGFKVTTNRNGNGDPMNSKYPCFVTFPASALGYLLEEFHPIPITIAAIVDNVTYINLPNRLPYVSEFGSKRRKGSAVLEKDIQEMKELWETGRYRYMDIANKMGINQNSVGRILNKVYGSKENSKKLRDTILVREIRSYWEDEKYKDVNIFQIKEAISTAFNIGTPGIDKCLVEYYGSIPKASDVRRRLKWSNQELFETAPEVPSEDGDRDFVKEIEKLELTERMKILDKLLRGNPFEESLIVIADYMTELGLTVKNRKAA